VGDAKFLKPALLGKIRASGGGEQSRRFTTSLSQGQKRSPGLRVCAVLPKWISATTGGVCRSGGSLWSRRMSFGQLMFYMRIKSMTPFRARGGRPCMLGSLGVGVFSCCVCVGGRRDHYDRDPSRSLHS